MYKIVINTKQKIGFYRYKFQKIRDLYRFNNSKNIDILKSFFKKYENKRCFIVGNGPSLNIADLESIKNEITFGFNRIYYMFDKTDWRPTFYCSEDIQILQNSVDEINKLDLEYKFIPIILKDDYKIDIKNATYFNQIYNKDRSKMPDFSNDIAKYIACGGTVTYTAIQMAAYMGFKEIYLIGVDHSFARYIDKDGNLIEDKNLKDYFCDEYNKDKDKLNIPRLDESTKSYMKAEEYSRQHGFRIYNATRGGKLEVFERVDFDKLFD